MIFDGTSYSCKVTPTTARSTSPTRRSYLKTAQPDLNITDPYELTRSFDATIDLLKTQHKQIGNYWSSYTSQIQDFTQGSIVIGPTWPYQYNTLKADRRPVGVVLPKEGATGWADTWMMSSKAAHPNCMMKWMDYATTPVAEGKTAYTFGVAPANPKACTYLDNLQANLLRGLPRHRPELLRQHCVLEDAAAGLR